MYRYHPEIEGLKVNEDGSKIFLNGSPMRIGPATGLQKYVSYKNKTIRIERLVCECWNGMPSQPKGVYKIDKNQKNTHYTNLKWATVGGSYKTKKLSKSELTEIIKLLKEGKSPKALAAQFKVSENHIHRIKRKKLNG